MCQQLTIYPPHWHQCWMCDAKEAACLGLSIIYCLDWLFRAFRIYATQLTIKINLFRPRLISPLLYPIPYLHYSLHCVRSHYIPRSDICFPLTIQITLPHCWWLMVAFAFSVQKHALNIRTNVYEQQHNIHYTGVTAYSHNKDTTFIWFPSVIRCMASFRRGYDTRMVLTFLWFLWFARDKCWR